MIVLKVPLLVVVVVALSLSACANKKWREQVDASFPEVGAVATKGIGEELLIQGHGILVPLLIIPEDQAIGNFKIHKGKYVPGDQNNKGLWFSEVLGVEGDENRGWILLENDNKTICAWPPAGKTCAALRFTLETTISEKSPNYFQKTLLYNGKIGNRITLGYREFSNGMARSAFSNDVAYDLSESSMLGYKGARIEVIKATNTEITYKVLSGFE